MCNYGVKQQKKEVCLLFVFKISFCQKLFKKEKKTCLHDVIFGEQRVDAEARHAG